MHYNSVPVARIVINVIASYILLTDPVAYHLVAFAVACILMIVSAVWSWTKHVDSSCSGATSITDWIYEHTEATCTGLCEANPACQGFTLSPNAQCRLYATCDTIGNWLAHNSYNDRTEPTTQAPGVPVATKCSTNVPETTSKIAVTTSQVRITRDETTTEPHEITTEANRITTEAHEITTEAHGITTEVHKVTTGAHVITTEANKITTEVHETTTEAYEITTEANKITTEAHKITTEVHKVTTGTLEITTEAHDITSEVHEITTEAHEITTEAQERSTKGEDSTTEAQGSTTIKESATEVPNASTMKDGSSTETHKTTLNVPDYTKELTAATTEPQESSTNFQEITTVAEVYTEVDKTTGEKVTTEDSRDVTNQTNPLAEWADRVMQVGEYCRNIWILRTHFQLIYAVFLAVKYQDTITNCNVSLLKCLLLCLSSSIPPPFVVSFLQKKLLETKIKELPIGTKFYD